MHAPVLTPIPIPRPPTVPVLGVPVATWSLGETIQFVSRLVEERQYGQVCSADACGIALAQKNQRLYKIYQNASLVTCDSVGVAWAMSRQGAEIPRVCGIDLVEALCQEGSTNGRRFFFVGGEPGVAEGAATMLERKYPGCHVVGSCHGFFNPDHLDELVSGIAEARVDIVFVGMGNPRQEEVAAKIVNSKAAHVAMGVGGSFDVLSGRKKRASKKIQDRKLEWLYRTAQDPRKLKKLALLPGFVLRVLREHRPA